MMKMNHFSHVTILRSHNFNNVLTPGMRRVMLKWDAYAAHKTVYVATANFSWLNVFLLDLEYVMHTLLFSLNSNFSFYRYASILCLQIRAT